MKQLKASIILSLFLLTIPTHIFAKVSGGCANCHTMHNSQNGNTVFADGPQLSLLNNTCIGCHSHTSAAIYDLGECKVPVVYTTGGIDYGDSLAGGNFYWVEHNGDVYGHNAISNIDGNLGMGPGLSDQAGAFGCTTSCHYSLAHWKWPWPSEWVDGNGCIACHTPAHHKGGSDTDIADEENGWFRFLAKRHAQGPGTDLRNVKGLEDADWQQTVSSTDHNEYWDIPAYGGFGNAGISRFCNSCHTDFHSTRFGPWSGNGGFKAGPGGGWHTSPWFRHPSGIYLPAFGETSKYNTDGTGPPGVPGMFNPDVPVARQFIDTVTGPSSTVTTGNGGDMVSCISCHRAHGSPYPDMLRWDYSGQLAGGGGDDGTGCFVCHTTKDSE